MKKMFYYFYIFFN